MKSWAPLCGLVAAVFAAPALAADCDFLPKAAAPDWVTGSPAIAGFYTGVGQSQADNSTAPQSMERAKQAALRDLAGNIEVKVRSELRIQESTSGTPDELKTQVEVESSTQTAASALLGEVEQDANWLDRSSCVVWTRVRVAEPVVRALQRKQLERTKLNLMATLVATADDSTQAVDVREKALAQAEALLPILDFAYAEDGSNERYFRETLQRLQGAVSSARGKFEINAKDFAAAEKGLQQARRERGIAAQARLATDARALLVQVSASAPYNTAPDFWPEKATWALAEFERDTGNPCESQQLYEELARRSTDAEWQMRARGGGSTLRCGTAQRQTQALRRLVYGKAVTLVCIYDLGRSAQAWNRACADLQAQLTEQGALQVRVPDATAAQQAQWAESCRNGCDVAALGDLAVMVSAKGKVASRKNAENPKGKDYQFDGEIRTVVLNRGKAEFNDQYSGIGGWNPISSDMAMDVVAIQAGRRFTDKVAAHYQQGE